MIRLITTRHLNHLHHQQQDLHAQLAAAHRELDVVRSQLDTYQAVLATADRLISDLRSQVTTLVRDLEARDDSVRELRAEVRELVEEVAHGDKALEASRAETERARQALPVEVFVLLRWGQVHSLHTSPASAYHAAEEEGADPTGWTDAGPTVASSTSAPWFIHRIRTTHSDPT